MGERPSNRSIDALFSGARSARIRVRGDDIEPARGPVVLEVSEASLGELRAALRIREIDDSFRCMCRGDLHVELRGRLTSNGALSFHHGQSIRLDDWSSDAWLEDGPALLRLLAERGITEPLAAYDQAERARAEGERARERWLEGAPSALRPTLEKLEDQRMGSPTQGVAAAKEALAVMRASGTNDREIAAQLFAWLSAAAGPWNGYPAYEGVPLGLLGAMPDDVVRDLALARDADDARVRTAARYFASHEVVSFRKRVLRELPESFFDRARPLIDPADADALARLDHARSVARRAREALERSAPFEVEGGCTVIGQSEGGPLSGLVALDSGAVVSVDAKTLVRFDPGSTVPNVVAEASEHFVVLAGGRRLVWATMNDGEIFGIASGQGVVLEIVAAGDRVAWLRRDASQKLHIVTLGPDEALRVLVTGDASSLCADDERVYFIGASLKSDCKLRCVSWTGDGERTLCRVPWPGASMGSPSLVASEGEVLVAAGEEVRAVDARDGRVRTLVHAGAPVAAIAATPRAIAMLLVRDEDGERWTLAVAPRAGGDARVLGTFSRAPYHRHALVIAGDWTCTTAGDRILAARMD